MSHLQLAGARLALLALAAASCGSPAPRASIAPTSEQVRSAEIAGVFDAPVTLEHGVYEGPPAVEGGASQPRLELVPGLVAYGHLRGGAGEEAAAVLAASSGGSGETIYLSVIGIEKGAPRSLGTVEVGDRTQIRSFAVSGAEVVMDVVEAGPRDPVCCPTQLARKSYRFESGALKLAQSVPVGTLSLALLAGREWSVVEIDGEPLAEPPQHPSLAVAGDQLSGFSGCNRYSATIRETSPGVIALGPIAATQMACPEPEMQLEARFVGSLESAQRYAFPAGKLVLSGTKDGTAHSLTLRRD